MLHLKQNLNGFFWGGYQSIKKYPNIKAVSNEFDLSKF